MRARLPRTTLFIAVLLLLAISLFCVPASSLGATGSNTPLFQPTVAYDSGGYGPSRHSSIALADVNGDGRPDVIVANTLSATVGVLLGNGDGTFKPAVSYDLGGFAAFSVAAADVNGDGRPDLVVASCAPNRFLCPGLVGVLLGNGDGTFRSAVTYATGSLSPASAVAVADLNGDGKPDLIATNTGSFNGAGGLSVLLGNGDGTFQPAVTYDFGAPGTALAVSDVNGDGKPDVVVVNLCSDSLCDGAVVVLLGNGDGTFQPAMTYLSGGYDANSVAVADLNGDGKLDLVVGNQCMMASLCPEGGVGGLLGNGDGTFKPVVSYATPLAGGGVAVADVNGDGNPDLLVSNSCVSLSNCANGTVNVLLGNGDGTFQSALGFNSGGELAVSVAVADVNADGSPDLIVANFCASNACTPPFEGAVGVLLNNTPFDTTPPVITLSATPNILWPANGRMVPVTVMGTITDTGSGVNTKTAAYVVKDEYGEVQPQGAIALGPTGNYSFSVLLQASRLGSDTDGRRYMVTVRASDNAGNSGSKTTMVTVPHDQRR